MYDRTALPLSHCERCGVLWIATRGRAGGAVPDTQTSREAFLACFIGGSHRIQKLATVTASRIADLALLTVIRDCPRLDLVDWAHLGRAFLDVPEPHRRAGIPSRLWVRYGASVDGTAVALRAAQFMIIETRADPGTNRAWRGIRNTIMEAR